MTAVALLAINAGQDLSPAARAAAAGLAPGAPIVVMVHGYRFSPAAPQHDPHRHILSMTPASQERRAVSWPGNLGFTADGDEGLAIGFGWEARGNLRQVYRRAGEVGEQLAALIDDLATLACRPVAVICHSMGARVVISAMGRVRSGSMGRVVLLAGAEFRDRAEAALATPGGRRAEVINVTTRENDPYDFAVELLLRGGRGATIGLGLSHRARNWIDLQIDQPEVLAGLNALGFSVQGAGTRACHWSPYLREGMFDLYRASLCHPWSIPLALIAQHIPDRQAPRWSRLLRLRAAQAPSLGRA